MPAANGSLLVPERCCQTLALKSPRSEFLSPSQAQGLVVHADGRFVADLEMGCGVVRALRMARSDAAEGAGWRDLTGKLVFPGSVVLCRSGMPLAGRGGCPATTVGVPVASLAAPAARPGYAQPDADAAYAADAVPIPLLRGLEPVLEVLPEAAFGQGCAAFAVDDRILAEPGWDDDLVRVTGHCGATLVVLSDDARVMERSPASTYQPTLPR